VPLSLTALDAALARVAARRGPFGRRVLYVPETGSTNDVAANLADAGDPEGTLVVAGAQTSGRGRFGRVWHSPPGAGVYASLVCRPSAGTEAGEIRLLTLSGGVAVAEGIRLATGLSVELKWPNDVVRGRPWRKMAGLLAEASTVAGRIRHVVLGIGINVTPAAYPTALASHVTSLEAELGRPVEVAEVLAETLGCFGELVSALRGGRGADVLDRWRALAPSLPGSPVEWESPDGARRGTAAGVDETGALVVRDDRGIERLLAGEVRWI
jgi:BirA family biotin operon repressor/biotin-[acetyl-CoA-carboxylase] ligase